MQNRWPGGGVTLGAGRASLEETLQPETLAELYRRFAPVVHARVRRIVGRDADDIVQELFLRLLKSRPTEGKIASWIFTTSTNLAIDRVRHRARRDAAWEAEVRAAARGGADVETLLGDHEIARKVLASLDRKTQEVVVLVIFHDLTQEEAAQGLGLSRKTVNERMQRFQNQARALVETWRR
jgi:RNA polymerase sigma-70 factor, ECF subfamily